jgi:solute carrier family 20 (sodium-dependent phosphate transporter)
VLYLHNIPTWLALVISFIVAIVVAIVVQIVVVPWQKKKILEESSQPVKFSFGDSDGENFS